MSFSFWAACTLNTVLAAAIALHVEPLNGTSYWFLPWRSLSITALTPAIAASLLFIVLVPFVIHRSIRTGLILLSLWLFFASFAYAISHPDGFSHLSELVSSFRVTGYFNYAESITDAPEWLAGYHELKRAGHPSTHPPGWILFYYGIISAFGKVAAPYAASFLIAALLACSVPLFQLLLKEWGYSEREQKCTLLLFASSPGFLHWLPGIDLVLVPLTLLLLLFWEWCLKGALPALAGFIGALWLAAFTAYNVFVIGVFLFGRTAASFLRGRFIQTILMSLAALLGFALLAAGFDLITGFHSVDTFQSALHAQEKHLAKVPRPYWSCVAIDPLFFLYAVGSGSVLLLPLAVWWTDAHKRLVPLLALLQLSVVNFSGLLPAETNRLWLFLVPLWWALLRGSLSRIGTVGIAVFAASQLALALSLQMNFEMMKP